MQVLSATVSLISVPGMYMDRIGLVIKAFDTVSMRIELEREKVARYDTFDRIRIECIEASRTPDPDP